MATTTRYTFEAFQKLQDAAADNIRYELDEGDLIVTPSPTPRHNLVYLKLLRQLAAFVEQHRLGVVITEVDFRLSKNVVRKPDLGFIAKDHMKGFHLDRTPVEGAPSLAVEVISPSNLAQDTLKKIRQYLAAGSHAVWTVYPALRLVEIHDASGTRIVSESEPISESQLFGGHTFSLSLSALFDVEPER
ncbi:MAG TPA: Uma2 family endonuclease [Verrucomicrobiae bacterium]|jgi:Uma2 family endonuclease|nr:Uma2 family endonuclease [Verrucomicrobiae bacterium]